MFNFRGETSPPGPPPLPGSTPDLVFQNQRNILQELHILLTMDQEHKKVFQDILVAGFCNRTSPKDHLVSYQMWKQQEGLKYVGKETVRFVTLYVIQALFLPKPGVNSKWNT